jgi:D-proline reductase (dithiol) PrdB
MHDKNVGYMERSRLYYQAHGYEKPYLWAHHDEVPFSPLGKPLRDCTATIVTTAMPDNSFTRELRSLQKGDMTQVPDSLYIDELAWDKDATHTDDLDSYFPIRRLTELVNEGKLGQLAQHYYCVPTSYSQRQTIELDAPGILKACLEENVDIALLVPL